MIDIMHCILDFLHIYDQIKFIQLNNFIYKNAKIFVLDINKPKLSNKITQKIIEQNKFSQLKKINTTFTQIKNINFLENSLIELICRFNGIRDDGINKLTKLQKLDISFNRNIKNISFCTSTLRDLKCIGTQHHGNENLKILTQKN